jgi:hypothetical protein
VSQQTVLERFTKDLFALFDETFEQHHGIYLDKGTSFFETLATISAEQASRPIATQKAAIAAQVEHVCFYLDVLEEYMRGTRTEKADWDYIWQNARPVTAEEWLTLQQRLKDTYQRVLTRLKGFETWEGEDDISGALAMLIHTVYHLGEVRMAMAIFRDQAG